MAKYTDLIVWQKSFEACKRVYRLTSSFPITERYGISDQMRRASVSIMSNIAEGSRRTKTEWLHFIRISYGSCSELESQLTLAQSLGFGFEKDYQDLKMRLNEISRILNHILWPKRNSNL